MQAHPEATNPASGPTVPWTSGLTGDQVTVDKDPQQVNAKIFTSSARPSIHMARRTCPELSARQALNCLLTRSHNWQVQWTGSAYAGLLLPSSALDICHDLRLTNY